jgi:hypothetical protein
LRNINFYPLLSVGKTTFKLLILRTSESNVAPSTDSRGTGFPFTNFHAARVHRAGCDLFWLAKTRTKDFQNMSARTYPARVAAEAAQTPQLTIRRWIDSAATPLRSNDSRTSGSGNYCGLSRNRILQLAITQALLKSGLSLSRAAKYALEFSDSAANGREAGQLFPVGKSVLVIGNGSAAVNNVDFSVSVFDLSNSGVAVIVDLNAIVNQVDAVLNSYN